MDFDGVPQNAKLAILMHCESKTLMRLLVASKTWCGVASQNEGFWREKYDKDFGEWEGGDADFEQEYKFVCMWGAKEPKVLELGGHSDWVNDVKIKGSIVLSGSYDGFARVWDLDSMRCVRMLRESVCVRSVAFDDEHIFVGLQSGLICVWSFGSLERVCRLDTGGGPVWALCTSNDRLVSGDDHYIEVWDASTFDCIRVFEVSGRKRICVVGKEIVCGVVQRDCVHVFHEDNGLMYTLNVGEMLYSMCANSKHIFVGCRYGQISIWEKDTLRKVGTLNGGNNGIVGICSRGSTLITVANYNHINFWDVPTLTCKMALDSFSQVKRCMDCSNGRLVTGTEEGRILLLDFSS